MTNPPSRFGSRRMPHHRAENSCHDCPFEQSCDRIEALTAEKDKLGNLLLETADRNAREIVRLEVENERLRGLFAALAIDPDACAVARQYARAALGGTQ